MRQAQPFAAHSGSRSGDHHGYGANEQLHNRAPRMTAVDWVDLGQRQAQTAITVSHWGASAYIEVVNSDNYLNLKQSRPYGYVDSTTLSNGKWTTTLPSPDHWYVVAIGDGELRVDLSLPNQMPLLGGRWPAEIGAGEFNVPTLPGIPPTGPTNTSPLSNPPLGGLTYALRQLPNVTTEEANIRATARALNADPALQQKAVDDLRNRVNQLVDPTNPANNMSGLSIEQREALLNDAKTAPGKLKEAERKLWEITGPAQILSMDIAKLDALIKQKEDIANAFAPGAGPEAASITAEVKNSQRAEVGELKRLRQTYDDLTNGKIGPSELPDPPEKATLSSVLLPGLIDLALLATMFRMPRSSGMLSKSAPTLLTEADKLAFFKWSGGGRDNMWRVVNNKFYRNQPLSAEETAFADSITKALSKLPDYVGVAEREIPTSTATQLNRIAGKYQEGQITTENAFTASTRGSNEGFTSGLTFSIMSRHGKDISSLSAKPEQLEVLFDKGTRFFVLSKQFTPEGRIHIILREVD